jgi:uncharacterized protein YfdQ (DUF2303 family)
MNNSLINPEKTAAAQAESLQVAAVLGALASAVVDPVNVAGAHFVTLPPGFNHMDVTKLVEAAQPAPNRKRGTINVKDVASLLACCADQAGAAHSYIYADPDQRTICAVFNDHRAGPGWRDHRVDFKAEYTPEFSRWLSNNGAGKARGQTEFAEFIEDNLADITEPYAQQLLNVATTIQASSGINFSSAKRLQDGQTQLTYSETIEARAGADGALSIPKEFTLGLRIFKNGGGYLLKARLKYRLAAGSVKFWYELDRPERAVEDAFAGYVNEVREKSGYQVLIGAAG